MTTRGFVLVVLSRRHSGIQQVMAKVGRSSQGAVRGEFDGVWLMQMVQDDPCRSISVRTESTAGALTVMLSPTNLSCRHDIEQDYPSYRKPDHFWIAVVLLILRFSGASTAQ
jgi:hypothetical protein